MHFLIFCYQSSLCHAVFERSKDWEWHNPRRTSSDGRGDPLEESCQGVGNSKTRALHQQLTIINCSMFRQRTVAWERERERKRERKREREREKERKKERKKERERERERESVSFNQQMQRDPPPLDRTLWTPTSNCPNWQLIDFFKIC